MYSVFLIPCRNCTRTVLFKNLKECQEFFQANFFHELKVTKKKVKRKTYDKSIHLMVISISQ